ncbi:MAG: hypothetical protein ACLFTK_01075 [Anaerolineales bacterium]
MDNQQKIWDEFGRSFGVTEFFGPRLEIRPSVLVAMLLTWVGVGLFAGLVLNYALNWAVLAGLAVVLIHWSSLLYHHLGHHRAAAKTSFSLQAIDFWWWLATDLYYVSPDEVPVRVHMKRALGGPFASLSFSLLWGVAALFLYFIIGDFFYLAIFGWFLNLFGFTLLALVPFKLFGRESDGYTLRKYRQGAAGARALDYVEKND